MSTETAVLGGLLLLGIGLLIGWMLRARATSSGTVASIEARAVNDLTRVVDQIVAVQATTPAQQLAIDTAAAKRDLAIDAAVTALSKLKTAKPPAA